MTRLVRLTLDNVRNVGHGSIDFDDLESGGSVTGIYGQNGSGKTAVIDAIECLRALLAGWQLPDGSADIINSTTKRSTISAIFRLASHRKANNGSSEVADKSTDAEKLGPHYFEYTVDLIPPENGNKAKVASEQLRIGKAPNTMGRVIIAHGTATDGTSLNLPRYAWTSFGSVGPIARDIYFAERGEQFVARSFLFLPCHLVNPDATSTTMLDHIVRNSAQERGVSSATKKLLADKVRPACVDMEDLAHYARNDIFVSTTRRSSMASFQYVPIMDNATDDTMLFNLTGQMSMSRSSSDKLHTVIDTYNAILPNLVPHLKLQIHETPAPLADDGTPQVSVELMSTHGGAPIPFRSESEGVIRITGMLALFVHAYNDPDSLVAIDEIDAGVFEFLLGDMLSQITSGAKGQLVFTAHNLRPLEVLPQECIRFTVTDTNNRFTRGANSRPTNNRRKMYLSDVDLGWDGPDLYDAPAGRMFANSLFRAAHPRQSGTQYLKPQEEGAKHA